MRLYLVLLLALTGVVPLATANAQSADPVRVYRCTDSKGKLTLRDSPCAKGEQQQARDMLRPQDPKTPPLVTRTRVIREPAPVPYSRPLVIASAPMYQCTTPEGQRYTSASPSGNARWVPLWAPVARGYGYGQGSTVISGGGVQVGYRDRHTSVTIGGGSRMVVHEPVYQYPMGVDGPIQTVAPVYGAGTWVHDACEPMPREDLCAALSNRRYAINTRYVQAMPSERAELDRESRSIERRLSEECP